MEDLKTKLAPLLDSLPPRVRWKLPVLSGLTQDQTDSERRMRPDERKQIAAPINRPVDR